MATFLDKFNYSIPIKKHTDLDTKVRYEILKVEITRTSYGQAVLLTLLEENDQPDKQFKLFMPSYKFDTFDPFTVEKINIGLVKYFLKYEGVSGKTGKFSVEL